VHQPDYSRAARVVEEMMNGHTPNVWISDRYSAEQKHAQRIKPVWRIWRATRPLRWEPGSDDLPLRVQAVGLAKPSSGQRYRPVSKPRRSPAKSASLKATRGASCRGDKMRPRSQLQPKSSGARAASDLLRLSWRGRGHQQLLGAKAAALRDPAKSHKRLSRHVGRPSRSGCAHDRRYSKAKGRKPLSDNPRHPGLKTRNSAKNEGG